MKEFLIIVIAFIFFLLLRILKNQLTNSQKLMISTVFVGVLSFGIISRSTNHFSGYTFVILGAIIIILSLKLINVLRHRN